MDTYDSLDKAVKGVFGENVRMQRDSRISRQDINSAKVVTLSNGKMFFLKYNSIASKEMFDAEVEGLEAIASTKTIDTPHIYCTGTDEETNTSFLMMELIQEGVKTERAIGMLGNKMANLHLADASRFVEGGKYGFLHDNYIGSTKQINTPKDSWVDFFRECKRQIDYKSAPDRIKKLLAGFDTKLPFEITVKNAGGFSPRTYENTVSNINEKELHATAILSQSWSAALFEDGTLFLEGALPGRHILRSGMPVAIRLPKLPTGYVYSDFVISGTTLYAAWEESAFYKTGRSGFLQVNLDRTLYSRMI
jgi:hypothetical protein